jgi:hypothetical protein
MDQSRGHDQGVADRSRYGVKRLPIGCQLAYTVRSWRGRRTGVPGSASASPKDSRTTSTRSSRLAFTALRRRKSFVNLLRTKLSGWFANELFNSPDVRNRWRELYANNRLADLRKGTHIMRSFLAREHSAEEVSVSPYVAVAPPAVTSAEREVANAVKAAPVALTMGELVSRVVKDRKLEESNVREAIWRLISAGLLRLSSDRTIVEVNPR